MAKFTPYGLKTLPTNGIDVNGLYFIKGDADTSFKIYIRKSDNSAWISLGTVDAVAKVNGLFGDVKVDLAFTDGILKILATGTGTPATVAEIDLDARYRRSDVNINWSEITGIPNFALDDAVVKLTGNQTVGGAKTFSSSPVVPTPTANTHAVTKKYVDDADYLLDQKITGLEAAVNDGMRVPLPLDCSTNPNYPASEKGAQYRVTHAGKVGGASGSDVEVNDTIICIATNPGGTHATVGENFYITQANTDQATETVMGTAKIATQAKVDAGTDDQDIVTSKKLQKKLDDFETSSETANEGKYVRYNNSTQGLTNAQKSYARSNIGAAEDAAVVKLSGNQTVAGTKTFSTVPVLPASNPTTDNQATRKKYVDDTVEQAVAWGGATGKEW